MFSRFVTTKFTLSQHCLHRNARFSLRSLPQSKLPLSVKWNNSSILKRNFCISDNFHYIFSLKGSDDYTKLKKSNRLLFETYQTNPVPPSDFTALSVDDLHWTCDTSQFNFTSTSDPYNFSTHLSLTPSVHYQHVMYLTSNLEH